MSKMRFTCDGKHYEIEQIDFDVKEKRFLIHLKEVEE